MKRFPNGNDPIIFNSYCLKYEMVKWHNIVLHFSKIDSRNKYNETIELSLLLDSRLDANDRNIYDTKLAMRIKTISRVSS